MSQGFTKKSVITLQYPTGGIIMFGGATAPEGWLLCDGSAVSRSSYSALFAIISTTYGAGDSSTTFNLPDMRGVFPKGAGTTNRTLGKDANGNFYAGTLGTYSTDKFQGHEHNVSPGLVGITSGAGLTAPNGLGSGYAPAPQNTLSTIANGTNGTPRTGMTTEPQSLGLTYIIKT